MIIRSQDKITICNFKNVADIYTNIYNNACMENINSIVVTYTSGERESLGNYSTKEKALKVLDKIQQAYLAYSCYHKNEWKGGGNINDFKCIYIFQMPQDDEVEE